jgi:cell shape-determining protein MreC
MALRPVPLLDRALDLALLPTRVLAELSAPVGWIQGRQALAGGAEREGQLRRELFEHDALEAAVLDSALSLRSSAHPQAAFVHAEVVGRPPDARDTILVRVDDPAGIEVGMPVVTGDWFVGLVSGVRQSEEVSALDADGSLFEVELITGARARIAARVEDGPPDSRCELVVGGIAPASSQIYLDVHNPSQRWVNEGSVVVDEPRLLGERHSHLADGYRLGNLLLTTIDDSRAGTRTLACVLPGLDFESGLYQVLILLPRGAGAEGRAAVREPEDVLDDGAWASARLFLRSEPSPWREGRKLALGQRQGVHDGAALVSGVRLVGRVQHAGPMQSDVRLLGDPGFGVAALAMVEEADRIVPHVMGRIVSRGRDAEGALRFEWTATVPLTGEGERQARLWTGSGEVGVPRGLLLGDTVVPCGLGTHELRIVQPDGAREPKGLRVRLRGRP